ncbi:MAG: solute carrier family 13 (sodium-dependent dicarboxylate transporter), er 2/3/5 [Candidatus Thermoplasmatota archaeon]|nr:solute carrier family 13 (sodium-dependent dicarboxylate transporter), er 2/3/5 [Candidatus Thermoplasmatota archaeon]
MKPPAHEHTMIHNGDPKSKHSRVHQVGKLFDKRTIGLVLGPLLFLVLALMPVPDSMAEVVTGINSEAGSEMTLRAPQVALGTLLWVLVWWVTECVPLGLAALLPPIVFSMTRIVTWKTALTAFTDPIIWIFMAGFVLAAAFRKWDLDRRIALRLGLLYKGSNPMIAAFFVASLPVFILTLTGSITASTAVVFPFLIAYLSMAGVKSGSRYSEATMLVLAQAATAGAMLLLISTPPNLIAKNTALEYASADLTFLDWLVVGTPHAIIGLLVTWIVVFKVVKPEEKTIAADKSKMIAVAKQLGRMSRGEKVVAGMLVLAVSLWIFPSIVKILAHSYTGLQGFSADLSVIMPEAMPAVLVILLAGLIRVRGEPVLKWDEIARGIDWNVVFLFGGGIALGIGLSESGFATWLADGVAASMGENPSAWAIYAMSCLLGFVLTYAASNTAAALISCPIAATLALGAGLTGPDLLAPIIGAGLACSISSAIPSTTPPMAIVYSSGYVKIWTMFKVGIISDLIRLGALVALGPLFVSLLA